MIHTTGKVKVSVLLISLWTIVQSIVHIFWVIYGYLLIRCQIRPTYYDVVFVYMTYFYKQSCGPIHLKRETLFLNRSSQHEPEDEAFQNETSPHLLFRFLNTSLHTATWPGQSSSVNRTEMYLILLFIADAAWIISAVCLFVGAFWKTKQKYLSVVFYGPWLLCSAFMNLLDVVSAVQYGIDMIYIRSYTSWLDFIGVENFEEFHAFDDHPSASVLPVLPTTVVVSLLSRILFGWLLNVIFFFIILFLVIPDLFLKTTARPKRRSSSGSKLRFGTGDELDLNTSEARIRNWQIFYGAIEANSTMASASPRTSSGTSAGSVDTVYRQNPKKTNIDSAVYENHSYEKAPLDRKSSLDATSSGYRRFSDVANNMTVLPSVIDANNTNIPVLKGHMPWSYIKSGNLERKQYVYNINHKHELDEEQIEDKSHSFSTRL